IDGFDGDIAVEITKLPKGFTTSTPLVIQAGHSEAKGTIHAAPDAVDPGTNSALCKVKATSMINASNVVKKVNNFGTIKLGEKPKLYVALEPPQVHSLSNSLPATNTQPLELTIAPGRTVPAWLKIRRNG